MKGYMVSPELYILDVELKNLEVRPTISKFKFESGES